MVCSEYSLPFIIYYPWVLFKWFGLGLCNIFYFILGGSKLFVPLLKLGTCGPMHILFLFNLVYNVLVCFLIHVYIW